jgi:hypothetical protein
MNNKVKKRTKVTAVGFGLAVAVAFGIGLLHEARSADAPGLWPVSLEMRVPFEPTAFSSAGRNHLTYELYLTNFGTSPLTLRRIEVLDADSVAAQPIATFEGAQLDSLLQPVGVQRPADGSIDRQIAPGASFVVFMWLALDRGVHMPDRLRHRVFTTDSAAEGAIIGTHHIELHVLASPVTGTHWLADDGPSNDQDNHHRRGIFVSEGRSTISRRYAIDWVQSENGATFSGDARDMHSYHAYGKPVFAVADSTVVTARDGLPDNVPGHNEAFSPAVPITMDTLSGNTLTLDLGTGQFAYYFHLQPGSLRVKVGDHVRRGQQLAQVGDSGDAREPHLHFEITTSPKVLAGEGLPYLIDQYRITNSNGKTERRTQELPLRDTLVDFGLAGTHLR